MPKRNTERARIVIRNGLYNYMMANNFSTGVKKRKRELVPIDPGAEKEYFCIFCGQRAEWTALFDSDCIKNYVRRLVLPIVLLQHPQSLCLRIER